MTKSDLQSKLKQLIGMGIATQGVIVDKATMVVFNEYQYDVYGYCIGCMYHQYLFEQLPIQLRADFYGLKPMETVGCYQILNVYDIWEE